MCFYNQDESGKAEQEKTQQLEMEDLKRQLAEMRANQSGQGSSVQEDASKVHFVARLTAKCSHTQPSNVCVMREVSGGRRHHRQPRHRWGPRPRSRPPPVVLRRWEKKPTEVTAYYSRT